MDWKPARWDDIGSLPHQVVLDYWSVREGQAAAREPFAWFRPTERGVVLAHLFRAGPDGPEDIARCGAPRIPEAAYERYDTPPRCQRCDAIAAGKPTSSGTIGDLDQERAQGRA